MRRSLIVVPAVISVFLCICVYAIGAETVRPVSLRCEYLKDPLGIDVLNPRLSWKLKSARQGESQTAYHVLVASSQDKLDNDAGDLWDTGKVKTDQSIHIAYKGKSLQSHMQCFWKVRLWDKDGKASSWSKTAMWSMGLLDSKEWQAKWIGLDPARGGMRPWGKVKNGGRELPARYVRREFTVNKKIKRATAYVCGLGFFDLFVNGREVGNDLMPRMYW